jgi:hypothetical protein
MTHNIYFLLPSNIEIHPFTDFYLITQGLSKIMKLLTPQTTVRIFLE